MARRADPSVPLSVYATTFGDYTAGMHLVQTILLALLQRQKTGRGQEVAVSLFESLLALQMQEAAMWLQRRRDLNWGGFPLTGVFPTTDGALVLVGAFKANPLRDICRALDLPDLSADPRYATFAGMGEHKSVLQGLFRERFATNTTAHWLARLEEQDLLCAPVQTMAEALASPQTDVNGTVVGVAGRPFIGTPLRMEETAFRVRRASPQLGEHSDEILRQLGYPADVIDELHRSRVVA
jgi:crotonobetainyl-CoA:carnitine CoA-transferase CaiB-like acyl-CoA transferase